MSAATGPLRDPGHFDYAPYRGRPKIVWPNGARIAFWLAPNIEHYEFDPPTNPRVRIAEEVEPRLDACPTLPANPPSGFWNATTYLAACSSSPGVCATARWTWAARPAITVGI